MARGNWCLKEFLFKHPSIRLTFSQYSRLIRSFVSCAWSNDKHSHAGSCNGNSFNSRGAERSSYAPTYGTQIIASTIQSIPISNQNDSDRKLKDCSSVCDRLLQGAAQCLPRRSTSYGTASDLTLLHNYWINTNMKSSREDMAINP